MVYSILGLIGAFCLGYGVSTLITKVMSKIEDDKASKKVNDVYTKLPGNINSNKTKTEKTYDTIIKSTELGWNNSKGESN